MSGRSLALLLALNPPNFLRSQLRPKMQPDILSMEDFSQRVEFQIKEDVPTQKKGARVFWPQGSFYFNTQTRVATLTDVKYINENLVVVAHRAAAKLYLVEIRDGSFEILDSLLLDTAKYSLNIKKRFGGQRYFHPDLISTYNNNVYMSEYTDRCCIVNVKGRRLIYEKTIGLGGHGFHGCAADNGRVMFGSIKDGYITSLDPNTYETTKIPVSYTHLTLPTKRIV